MRTIASVGTDEERNALRRATERTCACKIPTCPVYELLGDERTLRRLIFYRRYATALVRGEWMQAQT